jgi:hypothetical protein
LSSPVDGYITRKGEEGNLISGLVCKMYLSREDNIKLDLEPRDQSVCNALIWIGIEIRIAEFFKLREKF